MSARRPLTRVLLLHSAQLGGHLAPTSSVGHCPRWVPHPRGWLETCAAKRHLPKVLVKVLENAVDSCRRSRMVPMRKTPRVPAAFSLGRLLRPLIDRGQCPQSSPGWWIPALYIIIISRIIIRVWTHNLFQ